jgi:hypothetical protein
MSEVAQEIDPAHDEHNHLIAVVAMKFMASMISAMATTKIAVVQRI